MRTTKNGNPRKIDVAVRRTSHTMGSKFALMSKTKITAWKAYLTVFFVAGFFAALILGAYNSWYVKSRAAAPIVYSLTTDEVHRTGDTFQTQILLDSSSQNIVAVQAVATYDPATVSVTGVDTATSDFPNEVRKNLDTQNSKIFIASAKQTPGVNSDKGVIGVVNLTALKDFNGAGITLKLASFSAVDDSAAILDDGIGTNVISAVLAKFTNPAPPPPPVDTTPPVRSGGAPTGNLAAGTTQTTLKVTTNENAICKYATTAGTSYSNMSNTFSTTGALQHSTNITGLTDGKTYNYYVRCQDTAANMNVDDYPITFSVGSAPPPTNGPIISSVTASTTATGATVKWTTDVPATTLVEYGLTSSYGSQTTLDTNLLTSHSANISGLTANTTFHYRVISKNAAGQETKSGDYSLKTKKAAGSSNPGKGRNK